MTDNWSECYRYVADFTPCLYLKERRCQTMTETYMYYIDYHSHTFFSYDGHNSFDEMCSSAVKNGFSEMAFTDHYDLDGQVEGFYEKYDEEGAYRAISEAREKYDGQLKILYGIELGQPHVHPKEAEKLLKRRNFDFVIGSLHNLAHVPDFYYLDFEKMDDRFIAHLFDRYLNELESVINFDGINTVAHITYPIRYIRRGGHNLDLTEYYDRFSGLFAKIISNGLCLEVNASGLRQGLGAPVPDYGILRLYYKCGGRALTVGADAHYDKDVGAGIKEIYPKLSEIGFEGVYSFRDGKHLVKFDS